MKKSLGLITCILALAAALSGTAHAASVHGKIYDWSTFAKLDNVIVEINTTPKQKVIASSGEYSFNTPKGSYKIEARYYKDNLLEYFAEENITVSEEGNFVLDIIMFPALFDEALFEYENETEIAVDENLFRETGGKKSASTIFAIAALLAGIVVFYAMKKRRAKEEAEKELHEKPAGEQRAEELRREEPQVPGELPDDLKKLVVMIKEVGGRTTQQELREKLQCSDAKLSLMLADLENRQIIRKIKKGRGNIIILYDKKE